jgi:glycosyltransferase involved in cell wall biosynthesis
MVTARRKVVVRIITRLNIGGPARQALALSKELSDFDTVLVAGRPTAIEGELRDPDVPVQYAPLVRAVRPATDVAAFRHLRRVVKNAGPVIVHTHMAKAGALGRLAALTVRPRPRTVHTFHGHVLDGYFSAPVQRAFIEAERQLARATDVLLAISPRVRDSLLDLGIGRAEQYRVASLGIDLTPYVASHAHCGSFRSELGLPQDAPLVGMVGRLVPIKDGATMIEAIGRAPAVHLAIVGDGESRPELERLAEQRGIGGRVHFMGWRNDIAAMLGELDVVALSSRNEGTPVALIEALAAGVPVVATRVGGVADVVDDGVTGYLVSPGDPASLSRAIVRLLDEPSLGRRFGAEGRARMIARFSLARLVDEIGEIYDGLIDVGPSKSLARAC